MKETSLLLHSCLPENSQRIKKPQNTPDSSVILLKLIHAVLTLSDKGEHVRVLFCIRRALTLNVLFNGQSCSSGTLSSCKHPFGEKSKTNKQSKVSELKEHQTIPFQELWLLKLLNPYLYCKPFSFSFSNHWCCWINCLLMLNANVPHVPKLHLHPTRSLSSKCEKSVLIKKQLDVLCRNTFKTTEDFLRYRNKLAEQFLKPLYFPILFRSSECRSNLYFRPDFFLLITAFYLAKQLFLFLTFVTILSSLTW